jgi:glycosyltransferase involved in cell wall biosynthesis
MRVGIVCDLAEEGWPSMDILAAMLLRHGAQLPGFELSRLQPRLPAFLRGPEGGMLWPRARKVGLAFGRYLEVPLSVARARTRFDWFHVVDHSYAHVSRVLPAGNVSVFCHDLDTFRPVLSGGTGTLVQRKLAALALDGLRRAAVVFHSTPTVRAEILEHRLVSEDKLVSAPYGVGEEFAVQPNEHDREISQLAPFVLHVSSLIPRKNPELLLDVFARARQDLPGLKLVQIGGVFSAEQRGWLERRGLLSAVRQIARLDRRDVLAAYYRAATALVLPSSSEGFGLPVIEALACGAPVVVSDIPVFRAVAGSAAVYCPLEEPEAWRRAIFSVAGGGAPPLDVRLSSAARYSWQNHAATILGAAAHARSRP